MTHATCFHNRTTSATSCLQPAKDCFIPLPSSPWAITLSVPTSLRLRKSHKGKTVKLVSDVNLHSSMTTDTSERPRKTAYWSASNYSTTQMRLCLKGLFSGWEIVVLATATSHCFKEHNFITSCHLRLYHFKEPADWFVKGADESGCLAYKAY